jgi:DNA polymerase III alpha subunit
MDVDIDFPTDFDPLDYFEQAVRASRVFKEDLAKHPAGAYLQNIPVDPMTNLAAIPFKEAEEIGYFKIDFLHLSLLDHFETKEQIRTLANLEPDWNLLLSAEHVSKLFQIHRYADLIFKVKPKSVQELADCIAMIRPAKRHLVDAYIKNREVVRPEIYTKPEDGKYHFKKPHAIAYAVSIVLQLHLIKGGIL